MIVRSWKVVGDLPVTINADHAKGNYPDNAVFTGNVDINQGNSRLRADEVQLHQQQAAGRAAGAHGGRAGQRALRR